MSALLLKDWYVIRRSFWSIALIMVVWAVIPQGFLNNFAIIYGAMLPYSLMAFDQRSRWDQYARVLPLSDGEIVLSRYVLGWLSLLLGVALVCGAQGLLSGFWDKAGMSISGGAAAFCVGCMLLALNIPLLFRFGTEKARWVSVFVIFSLCVMAGALGNLPLITGGAYRPGLQGIVHVSLLAGRLIETAVPLALAILATAVSIPLSLKFYREGHT